MTFTLPYAGATRIRFKGLPVSQALSLTLADTPSNEKNRIRSDHPLVAREYGFKFIPLM